MPAQVTVLDNGQLEVGPADSDSATVDREPCSGDNVELLFGDVCSPLNRICTVDIDECETSPCLHASLCQDSHDDFSLAKGSYRCTCDTGWSGDNRCWAVLSIC